MPPQYTPDLEPPRPAPDLPMRWRRSAGTAEPAETGRMGGLLRLNKRPSGKRDLLSALRGVRPAVNYATMEKPPAKRALEAIDQPTPAAPISIAPRRISAKVRRAIDLMVNGDCKKICDAAAKVGLARESLSRALSTPHVAEYLRQQTMRRLAIAAARAGSTKVELLDSANEMVRDRSSSFILGLAGIPAGHQPITQCSTSR